MLTDVLQYLLCPHCERDVTLSGNVVSCAGGHTFDVAKEGYLNLLVGDPETGTADTSEMVRAREAFLDAGHYAAIADTVAVALAGAVAAGNGCIVDLGAGTGYYLARVLDELPDLAGIALDISKHALRRAARAHDRIGAVGCDAWRRLPVRTEVAAAVLSIFAPRNPAEIRRVLGADGVLVVVSPTPRHLEPLVVALGLLMVDDRKQDRIEEKLGPYFSPDRESVLEFTIDLGRADLERVILMGPSAWHTDPDDLRMRLQDYTEPATVLVSINIALYRPREEPQSNLQVIKAS